MKISVKIDGLDALQAKLRGLADSKIKVAAVAALNDAAYVGAQATKKTMAQVFDRPTTWVMGGVRYVKARSDKLEASIDFDQWGNKTNVTVGHVLAAEIVGGHRKYKRHEIALQRAGILPPGMFIVPGEAADIDQFGGMKGAQIVQILSWFSALQEVGNRSNMTDATRDKRRKGTKKTQAFEFFYVAPGARRTYQSANGKQGSHKMQPGIYKRVITAFGSAIRPVMIFVRSPIYKRRLDFYGIAEKAARAEFDRAFPMYLDKLLKERGL